MQGCTNKFNYHLKYVHQHIIDIDDDNEDNYRDKFVYESDNDGNDNVDDDRSDGEDNGYQKGDQQQGEKIRWSRVLCMEDSRCIR